MAAAAKTMDDSEAPAAAPEAAPAKGKSKLGLIIGIVVVLLAAGGGGAYFMLGKKAAAEKGAAAEGAGHVAKAAPIYQALSPSFVANLDDEETNRYLQVEMEVMARDNATIDQVKLHTPRIRDSLLMLLGQQKFHELNNRAGKEALQKKVLAEVQRIMKEETGKPGVEAVYFTSFVMQ